MTSKQPTSCSPTMGRRRITLGLSIVLGIAVAMPEELPAAPTVGTTRISIMDQPNLWKYEWLRVHCCHAHPLPPYDGYCCHSGAVVVAPGYGYYGAAGVRGQSRRVARRTTRRVSRRR